MASFVLFISAILLPSMAKSAEQAVLSLECDECFGDGLQCVARNCSHEETCIGVASAANLSTEHRATTSFTRSCVNTANYLLGSFSFDFGDEHILDFNSKVCNETDPECNFVFKEDSMRIYENGYSCPKCFRTGYDNCDSDGDTLCLGELVNCNELNGEITSRESGITIPFAGKGCASRSACDLAGKSFIRQNQVFKFKKVLCSKANGVFSSLRRLAFTLGKEDLGPQVAFFFPCILGILAVKIHS